MLVESEPFDTITQGIQKQIISLDKQLKDIKQDTFLIQSETEKFIQTSNQNKEETKELNSFLDATNSKV